MAKNCGVLCCPRCHYSFIEESKTVNFLKRIWGNAREGKEGG